MKDPKEMFKEIDALCEEVEGSPPAGKKEDGISDIQRVMNDQENKEREKRKKQYSQLLSCRLIDIEIQPYESPLDRASLTIRSAVGCHRGSVEVSECFALIEFLHEHGFNTLSMGKIRRDRDQREDDDRIFTWFILGKESA